MPQHQRTGNSTSRASSASSSSNHHEGKHRHASHGSESRREPDSHGSRFIIVREVYYDSDDADSTTSAADEDYNISLLEFCTLKPSFWEADCWWCKMIALVAPLLVILFYYYITCFKGFLQWDANMWLKEAKAGSEKAKNPKVKEKFDGYRRELEYIHNQLSSLRDPDRNSFQSMASYNNFCVRLLNERKQFDIGRRIAGTKIE
ncbi:uncharacterized protein FOMMEDRAFT_162681 [Fomitiporia mediterranea MF3/22]|uniref:Uncharacterized protein n=1 Tax=Fomitiporia mediterranea (strain MF3/22) TaxID=694068 RepID=R7SGX3_FOMME|nr:uncharacterized protein FOMMEDRAFT_162681 [Fomitiporia mediterranea MF3/22]EJC97660.1 hypothetical protein FOMMEDRAFT_162681 [Fomitiporia mediterranea MF3/22]